MAYKLLKQVLPVDIVNKVLEYNVIYNSYVNLFLIHKTFCILKIQLIGLNKQSINEIKKYNYTWILIKYCHVLEKCLLELNIIYTEDAAYFLNRYIDNKIKKCNKCKKIDVNKYIDWDITIDFCSQCDYSMCKDDKIAKIIHDEFTME